MLILERRKYEKVIIRLEDGRQIVVLPVAFKPDAVRMGFEAPPGIAVDREEVYLLKTGQS